MTKLPTPTIRYFGGADPLSGVEAQGPPPRVLTLEGRVGVNASSVHTRLSVGRHTINSPRGAMTLWVLPLEDLSTIVAPPHISQHEPRFDIHPLIADREALREWERAGFALVWASHWYPQFFAKFYEGNLYPDAYEPTPRAAVTAGHLNFHQRRWVQLALTWDKPASDYRLYANGVLVATSNRFAPKLAFGTCAEHLFLGNPCLALGGLSFYDVVVDDPTARAIFDAEAGAEDHTLDAELRRVYAGAEPRPFEPRAGDGWTLQLESSLNRAGDLDLFHVQGNAGAPSITHDGLLIDTPMAGGSDAANDREQVYLWTRRPFEGDLSVEFEFMPTRHNGLSLLMLHASGMQREDFMADYPPRTTGSMSVVYGENVRNYHWEFWREMDDTRNDVASSVLVKQPWNRPLAYRCGRERLALNAWHSLQFVQTGARLRGGIDGVTVFDVIDDPFTGSGGFYTFGRFAIRCMTKTRNLYRNLSIYTR